MLLLSQFYRKRWHYCSKFCNPNFETVKQTANCNFKQKFAQKLYRATSVCFHYQNTVSPNRAPQSTRTNFACGSLRRFRDYRYIRNKNDDKEKKQIGKRKSIECTTRFYVYPTQNDDVAGCDVVAYVIVTHHRARSRRSGKYNAMSLYVAAFVSTGCYTALTTATERPTDRQSQRTTDYSSEETRNNEPALLCSASPLATQSAAEATAATAAEASTPQCAQMHRGPAVMTAS